MNEAKIVLNARIEEEDSGATSLREYFKLMLQAVFDEDEGFSGKRPFGNSGWQHGLAIQLVKAGVLDGKLLTDDGYDDAEFDWAEYNRVIKLAINSL